MSQAKPETRNPTNNLSPIILGFQKEVRNSDPEASTMARNWFLFPAWAANRPTILDSELQRSLEFGVLRCRV